MVGDICVDALFLCWTTLVLIKDKVICITEFIQCHFLLLSIPLHGAPRRQCTVCLPKTCATLICILNWMQGNGHAWSMEKDLNMFKGRAGKWPWSVAWIWLCESLRVWGLGSEVTDGTQWVGTPRNGDLFPGFVYFWTENPPALSTVLFVQTMTILMIIGWAKWREVYLTLSLSKSISTQFGQKGNLKWINTEQRWENRSAISWIMIIIMYCSALNDDKATLSAFRFKPRCVFISCVIIQEFNGLTVQTERTLSACSHTMYCMLFDIPLKYFIQLNLQLDY